MAGRLPIKNIEYIIIRTEGASEMETKVNQRLGEGYQLSGPLIVDAYDYLLREMVRYTY